MSSFIVLPTQLFKRSKAFWKQWDRIIVIEEPYYINKFMHPLKLWMHRASMLEYFDSIEHETKIYIKYDEPISLHMPYTLCHPTDKAIMQKYKKGMMIDSPSFILKLDDLKEMDSYNDVFYKKMRVKLDILMNGSTPIGNKWSFDESNRQRFPIDYIESNPLDRDLINKYITEAKPIMKLSNFSQSYEYMRYPTNRKMALYDLKIFVERRLDKFGPYQDAMDKDIVVGNHSCISAPLNIGLITPYDVISEVLSREVPIESLEGFIRQVIGWREYIRMKYVLHGDHGWDHLKDMNNKIDKSWYNAQTGIEILDNSIQKVLDYAYAPHTERLMLLANYAVLFQVNYLDAKKWFTRCFIDAYPWVMLNVSMGVNGLNTKHRYMKRAYLTNGTYLVKMGLKVPKHNLDQLKSLYNQFIRNNKKLCARDYRLAAAVKRLEQN